MKTSETIGKLAASLALAQVKLANTERNRTVTIKSDKGEYSYNYSTLDTILEHLRPVLAAHSLALMGGVSHDGDTAEYVAVLADGSGEWISSSVPILPQKDGPQAWGSALTYAKRYAILSLLPIASEEDDDATVAEGHQHVVTPKAGKPKTACPKCQVVGAIIPSQYDEGGFVCWKKAKPTPGCGAKFATDPSLAPAAKVAPPEQAGPRTAAALSAELLVEAEGDQRRAVALLQRICGIDTLKGITPAQLREAWSKWDLFDQQSRATASEPDDPFGPREPGTEG